MKKLKEKTKKEVEKLPFFENVGKKVDQGIKKMGYKVGRGLSKTGDKIQDGLVHAGKRMKEFRKSKELRKS